MKDKQMKRIVNVNEAKNTIENTHYTVNRCMINYMLKTSLVTKRFTLALKAKWEL